MRNAVQEHINEICTNVMRYWTSDMLQELNDELATLDRIDANFSAYDKLYSSDWSRKIRQEVEQRIDEIVAKVRGLLLRDKSEEHARSLGNELILLGRIFGDLPRFRDQAKIAIGMLLDQCQDECGISYLFKLGMLLEQGKAGRRDAKQEQVLPEDKRVGIDIIHFFPHFRDVRTVVWNKETRTTQMDVSAIVKVITCRRMTSGSAPLDIDVDTAALQRGFDEYTKEYRRWIEDFKAENLNLPNLVSEVIQEAKNLQHCSVTNWSAQVRKQIPYLLASVAAYFTISKSGASYQRMFSKAAGGSDARNINSTRSSGSGVTMKPDDLLQRPHNTQVLTILHLFGYDSPICRLDNQLMKVRTFEGKSMILGLSSLILALLGFRVRCVCYSEYLSQRDLNLFKDLFQAFGAGNRIKYSKITTFSEEQTASKGNIRELTLELMRGALQQQQPQLQPQVQQHQQQLAYMGSVKKGGRVSVATPVAGTVQLPSCQRSCVAAATATAAASATPVPEMLATQAPLGQVHGKPLDDMEEEILLVDEVDVSFGKDFYGQTHNQVAVLEETEVTNILTKVWQTRAQPRSQVVDEIKRSAEYCSLLQRFPGWDFLFDAEVEQLCQDVKQFDSPAYVCDRGENHIGYKVMDGVCYDVVYGYKTAFATLQEAENGNFQDPQDAKKSVMKLRVSCGQFSYSNIHPACILGVSGTVDALGDEEWRVMNKFNLSTFMDMPSVYGPSNFQLVDQNSGDPMTVTQSRDEHFMKITDQVKSNIERKRAAIVIFQDAAGLQYFVSSPYFQQVQKKEVLTEDRSNQDKEYIIKKAATAGQATFTWPVFGRGTDFFCNDSKVDVAGGVHIVHAFFSVDKSEEFQIRGRTARQGKKGT